ncbi:MAG: CPBP family intramembrane glutamic endopeptidase [Candidatus Woesearchaeota archaeon]
MFEIIFKIIIPGIILGLLLDFFIVRKKEKYIYSYIQKLNWDYIKNQNYKYYLKTIIASIILTIILIFTLPYLNQIIIDFYPNITITNTDLNINPFLIFLYIIILTVTPIFEEWLFRGIILTEIKEKTNSKILGIILSSGLFSLIHITNPGIFPPILIVYFIGGLFLGIFYTFFGLNVVIIAHIIYNLFSFLS